ncbi:MAG: response regulator, partial [Desulfuromonadales bacterium]|nr:response regulator [Desulfuromonadales bacterium]
MKKKMSTGSPLMAKILIVDDDVAMLKSLHMLLKTKGYLVESAEEGGRAVELLAAHAYDLLLLDLQMPGVN